MTIIEYQALIQAVCPILGCGSDGSINFDPVATPAQQQAALAVVAANVSKVNGQPSRLPLDPLVVFNAIKPGGSLNLSQAQQLQLVLACCTFVLVTNPGLAQRINTALNLNIQFDQANPSA